MLFWVDVIMVGTTYSIGKIFRESTIHLRKIHFRFGDHDEIPAEIYK